MRKSYAIEVLGGSIAAAAEAIGVSYQAVDKWPDELPPRIADRVYAALWKRQHGDTLPPPPTTTAPQGEAADLPKVA